MYSQYDDVKSEVHFMKTKYAIHQGDKIDLLFSSSYTYRVQKNINFLHKLHIMYTEFYSVHFRDSTDHIIIYEKKIPPLNIKVFHVYSFIRWMGIFMRIFSSLIFMCATSTHHPLNLLLFFSSVVYLLKRQCRG